MVCGSSWREEREVSLALARRERKKTHFMLEDRERGASKSKREMGKPQKGRERERAAFLMVGAFLA